MKSAPNEAPRGKGLVPKNVLFKGERKRKKTVKRKMKKYIARGGGGRQPIGGTG